MKLDMIMTLIGGTKMIRLNKTRYDKKTQKSYFNFKCDCGNIIEARSDTKKEFCSKPGCKFSKRKIHGSGNKKNKLYRKWEGIRGRCIGTHHSSKTYKNRNISICEEWMHNFLSFKKWCIKNGYDESKNQDIDRIDINKDYSPQNCRLISRSENVKQQHLDGHGTSIKIIAIKNNKKIKFNSMIEFYNFLLPNISYKTLTYHIKKGVYDGWTISYQ